MKAIETRYAGYLFRSRLEARWAVFFDTLGLKWEYEPEGFDLGGGVYYLPDFRVTYPNRGEPMDVWFEVKRSLDAMTDEDWLKCRRFSDASSGNLYILDGAPEVRSYLTVDYVYGSLNRSCPDRPPNAEEMRKSNHPNRQGGFLWCSRGRIWWDFPSDWMEQQTQYTDGEELRKLTDAVNAARGYRFGQGGRA